MTTAELTDKLADVQTAIYAMLQAENLTGEQVRKLLDWHGSIGDCVYDAMTNDIEGGGVNTATGVDVAEYCRIHAKRAEAEGLTKTALVLGWAAKEIESLRAQIKTDNKSDRA